MSKVQRIFSSIALASVSLSLIACSPESNKEGTAALFDTKAEAEKAAKSFNCVGAHKMGDKWMPCKTHKAHEKHQQQSAGHSHHQ